MLDSFTVLTGAVFAGGFASFMGAVPSVEIQSFADLATVPSAGKRKTSPNTIAMKHHSTLEDIPIIAASPHFFHERSSIVLALNFQHRHINASHLNRVKQSTGTRNVLLTLLEQQLYTVGAMPSFVFISRGHKNFFTTIYALKYGILFTNIHCVLIFSEQTGHFFSSSLADTIPSEATINRSR